MLLCGNLELRTEKVLSSLDSLLPLLEGRLPFPFFLLFSLNLFNEMQPSWFPSLLALFPLP